jgi:serine/threonine protein kinase
MSGFSEKYRLDQRLGGGGMAEVFLGSTVGAEGFSRKVAIKRVLPGYSDNPDFAKMFVAEARISSRLAHPNIVSVLDFDRDAENRLFLVMELVEGKDLDALASSGMLPFPVIIFVMSEVLRGLGHAHDLPVVADVPLGSHTIRSMKGVVHRDVSPHNVLLSWEGAVKVSDFGIAKAREASSATASVFIKGKPAYMSPEQANGESLDGRSDLFAVGVMMWEMLVGRRLFVGEDTRATLAAVLFGQVPWPRALRPDVPPDLERVVMKLLERDLPARYQSAEQAIADLLECQAAPRDGREVLRRTLAERFPQQAPVRHSVLRQRGATPAHVPAYPTPTPLPPGTQGDGGLGRAPPRAAAALPSLGQLQSAPTSTLPPSAAAGLAARPRHPIALFVVGGLLAALIAVGIVVAVAGGGKSTGTPGTPAGSGADPVVAAAPADAAPADAAAVTAETTAEVTIERDAAVAESPTPPPKKDASATQPAHSGTDKRTGRLIVRAFPVLTVYVDNRKIHDTPVDLKLPVGKHTVKLVGDGKQETIPITIDDAKPTTIERF